MLYLAQVQKQEISGEPKLRLLARQESETAWAVIADPDQIPATEAGSWNHSGLVLVQLSPTGQVLSIHDATDWVMQLVENYLTSGITPAFLQQEKERIEQGLQTLTLEKQTLATKTLELEARREEIQALETRLNREQQELEARRKELQAEQQELEARRKELQALEERLKGEQKEE